MGGKFKNFVFGIRHILTLKNMLTKLFRNSKFSDFLGINSEINHFLVNYLWYLFMWLLNKILHSKPVWCPPKPVMWVIIIIFGANHKIFDFTVDQKLKSHEFSSIYKIYSLEKASEFQVRTRTNLFRFQNFENSQIF